MYARSSGSPGPERLRRFCVVRKARRLEEGGTLSYAVRASAFGFDSGMNNERIRSDYEEGDSRESASMMRIVYEADAQDGEVRCGVAARGDVIRWDMFGIPCTTRYCMVASIVPIAETYLMSCDAL